MLLVHCRIDPHVAVKKKSPRGVCRNGCASSSSVTCEPVQPCWSSALSIWRRMPFGLCCATSLELICWCWLDRYEKHFNLYVCMCEQTCAAFQPSVTQRWALWWRKLRKLYRLLWSCAHFPHCQGWPSTFPALCGYSQLSSWVIYRDKGALLSSCIFSNWAAEFLRFQFHLAKMFTRKSLSWSNI